MVISLVGRDIVNGRPSVKTKKWRLQLQPPLKATDKLLKKRGPAVLEHRGAGVWGETPGRAVEATTELSDSILTKAWCNYGETAEISPLAIICLLAHCYTIMTGHPD
jgi:hypothetical protein